VEQSEERCKENILGGKEKKKSPPAKPEVETRDNLIPDEKGHSRIKGQRKRARRET